MKLNFEDEIALNTNGEIKSTRDQIRWALQGLSPFFQRRTLRTAKLYFGECEYGASCQCTATLATVHT